MTLDAGIDAGEDEAVGAPMDPADAQAARKNDRAAKMTDRKLMHIRWHFSSERWVCIVVL